MINELDDRGFVAMRAPSSGSATERDLPDVLAGDGDAYYAIEVKASSGAPVYLDGEEIDALERFADGFGADALVGTRYDYQEWAFYIPQNLHETDGGNYRVKHPKDEQAPSIHIDDLSV